MPSPLKHTGFPSPANDYIEQNLNLNKYLVKHPHATFFVRYKGSSVPDLNIYDGDILVIDKSISPKKRAAVITEIDGRLKIRKFTEKITHIWGTVTSVIRKL